MTVVGVFSKGSTDIGESTAFEVYTHQFGISDAFCICNWFEGNKKLQDVFPEESLDSEIQ